MDKTIANIATIDRDHIENITALNTSGEEIIKPHVANATKARVIKDLKSFLNIGVIV